MALSRAGPNSSIRYSSVFFAIFQFSMDFCALSYVCYDTNKITYVISLPHGTYKLWIRQRNFLLFFILRWYAFYYQFVSSLILGEILWRWVIMLSLDIFKITLGVRMYVRSSVDLFWYLFFMWKIIILTKMQKKNPYVYVRTYIHWTEGVEVFAFQYGTVPSHWSTLEFGPVRLITATVLP